MKFMVKKTKKEAQKTVNRFLNLPRKSGPKKGLHRYAIRKTKEGYTIYRYRK